MHRFLCIRVSVTLFVSFAFVILKETEPWNLFTWSIQPDCIVNSLWFHSRTSTHIHTHTHIEFFFLCVCFGIFFHMILLSFQRLVSQNCGECEVSVVWIVHRAVTSCCLYVSYVCYMNFTFTENRLNKLKIDTRQSARMTQRGIE